MPASAVQVLEGEQAMPMLSPDLYAMKPHAVPPVCGIAPAHAGLHGAATCIVKLRIII